MYTHTLTSAQSPHLAPPMPLAPVRSEIADTKSYSSTV